jgi:anti-sigma B factor antagonist
MVSIEVSTVEYDSHAVVALRGEIDVTDAAGVAAALAVIVARHPNVVIDLAGLGFIDCCGLRALAGAREQARRAGGDLQLAAPQRLVHRLLGLTGLDRVFSVHASLARAMAPAIQPGASGGADRQVPAR